MQKPKNIKQVKKIATRRNFEPPQARWEQSGNLIFCKATMVENLSKGLIKSLSFCAERLKYLWEYAIINLKIKLYKEKKLCKEFANF